MSCSLGWLTVDDIKRESRQLLEEYSREFEENIEGEIPVEEIAELHLDLFFDLDVPSSRNLPKGTLGAVYPDGRVFINQNLMDPRASKGRYRFTVAHEIGHWRFHQGILRGSDEDLSLFRRGNLVEDQGEGRIILCRNDEKTRADWQADKFAAFLLMPPKLVYPLYRNFKERYTGKQLNIPGHNLQKRISSKIAEKFNTSLRSTEIHLKELELNTEQMTLM